MLKRAQKISGKWIEKTRDFFIDFLDETLPTLIEPAKGGQH
jgi:hypothetical protein